MLALSIGSATAHAESCPAPDQWGYEVRGQLPHDTQAFTQGLTFAEDLLVESTGLYGQSSLRVHRPGSIDRLALPNNRFAEGLAWYRDQLWQLSWKAGELRVYTLQPLQLQKRIAYRGEGWGLTHDGQQFIMSDGSPALQFRHSESFARIGGTMVRAQDTPLQRLNELEWVAPWVLANIWQQDRIAVIDRDSGCVHAWLNLQDLWPHSVRPRSADVLNGIAWNTASQELWVTGKRWPRIYRLHVDELINPRTAPSVQ